MLMRYLNDPDGRKEARLSTAEVPDHDELLTRSSDFLCKYLVLSDKSRLFFAQNLSTHLAQILSFIRAKNPDISKIYISDHELSWVKELIEIPGYQLDATHSNYRSNEDIVCPNFIVEVLSFSNFEKEIAGKKQAAVFYVSHVSRVTGEVADIASIFKVVKNNNPNSVLIVDGAQSIGAMRDIEVEDNCDAYLGLSSKFIGAEPHLGFAFMSQNFFQKYLGDRKNYPAFSVDRHIKDIFSLWNSLQNPLYRSDFAAHIRTLKDYAVQKLSSLNGQVLFNPPHQAPHFLTLNFGSIEKNKKFVAFAEKEGMIVSENSGWTITPPTIPLVRIGLSIRVTKQDVDAVIEKVSAHIKKEATRD